MSVAEQVKAELLDKGRLAPAEFAKRIGCNREGVRWYTRQLVEAGILEKAQERGRGKGGTPLEVCKVVDWDRLADWVPPTGKDPARFDWDGLMAAFGIRIVDVQLPGVPHRALGDWA